MITTNKSFNIVITFMIFTFWITGCATNRTGGRDFSTNNVSKIFIGQTTKSDVSRYLGRPLMTKSEIDGSEVWTYSFVHRKKTWYPSLPGSIHDYKVIEQTEKSVKVKFGKNGVVTDCVFGTYSNAGTPFKSAVSVSIGRGNTTRQRCQDVR